MNGLPYYKAYPRDFIEGTIGMPFEIKCAYRVILDLIYMQGGKLPDDARYISGLLGCSIRKWTSIRAALLEMGKVQVSGEFLSNYRADKEIETLAKLQDIHRENASGPRKNKDLQKPPLNQAEAEPEAEPKATTSVVAAPRDASPIQSEIDPTDRERLLSAMGADASGMVGPNGKRIGTSADMVIAAKWSEHLSIEEQCRLIAERTAAAKAKHAAFAPNSFNYFTAAMADLVATKAQPMPQGSATGSKSDRDNQMQRWNKLGRKTA